MGSVKDLFDVTGKKIMITGGNKGIGKAISYGFAEAGADILIAARDVVASEQVCRDIEDRFSVRAIAYETDVSCITSVEKAVGKAVDEFKRIDVLISNAGITNKPRKNTLDFSEEEWDKVISVNLKGTFLVCSGVARQMVKQREGKIICMASIVSDIAIPGHSAYVASKGGIKQFVKALALELAPFNIQVNALGPHYFRSEITKNLEDPQKEAAVLDKIPLRRIGEPRDIVGSCIYLAARASDLVTGHLLMVDGGYTIL